MSAKRKLIFILSPSFSGSTLLTLLLAQHPRIATIGELKGTAMGPIEDYICSCGSKLLDCRFWQQLGLKLQLQGSKLTFEEFGTNFSAQNKFWNTILYAQVRGRLFETTRKLAIRCLPGLHRHYQRIMATNEQFIEAACELMDAEFFLDGSKDPNRLLYLADSGKWDIYVISMYRDGRAQSNSHRSKTLKPVTFSQAAKEWKSTILQMQRVCKQLPMPHLTKVYYEELCQNPEKVMNELWHFLSIDPLSIDWRNIDLKNSDHHILGNSMRTKNSIQIQLDEKWQRDVKAKELAEFEHIAGRLNSKLGYPENPGAVS